jgi:hypothetical protein
MVPKNLSDDKNIARKRAIPEILEKTEENTFFNSVITYDDKIWLFECQ